MLWGYPVCSNVPNVNKAKLEKTLGMFDLTFILVHLAMRSSHERLIT
jgi:hypothetical protein